MSEELKIIMDTIAQLGQSGKEAFVWYLVIKYALHYFTVLTFIAAVSFVAVRIVNAVRACQDDTQVAMLVSEVSGVRESAYYGQFNRREISAMRDWIRSKK